MDILKLALVLLALVALITLPACDELVQESEQLVPRQTVKSPVPLKNTGVACGVGVGAGNKSLSRAPGVSGDNAPLGFSAR